MMFWFGAAVFVLPMLFATVWVGREWLRARSLAEYRVQRLAAAVREWRKGQG